MKKEFYKIIVSVLLLLISCNCIYGQKKERNSKIPIGYLKYIEYSINRDWKEDSCGYMGKRKEIGILFETTDFLMGKKRNYIDSLLGEPVSKGPIGTKTIQYAYRLDVRRFEGIGNIIEDDCKTLYIKTVKRFILIDFEDNKVVKYDVFLE